MGKPILAFVHINKTAGTTFQFILKNSFGLGHCAFGNVQNVEIAKKEHLNFVKKFFPGLKCIAGHRIVEPTKNLGEDILPFTIVRDPVARCASHYAGAFHEGRTKLSFEEWIQTPRFQNRQTQMIAGEENPEKAIKLLKEKYFFVGLFERFDESVALFQALSPYPVNPSYQSKNVREKNIIKEKLLKDKESLKLLKKYNTMDLKVYEAVAKEIFPSLLKKAGISREIKPSFANFSFRVSLTNFYNQVVFRRLSRIFY